MSQENVEAVRRLFAAFPSVDVGNFERRLDEVREIFDPEVEWVAAPHSLLASEEYRGYDGVRRFWTQFLSAWDEYGVQVEELIDAGDQVVVVMRLSGRTNELEIDEARSSLLTLRDGRIVRIEPFASKDGALEAAGLRDQAMSEENVALARKAIDALNRGDFDALLAFLSPDVAWEALEGVSGIGELYRGRAGVREWIELMWENAEEGVHIEIEQITDLGDDRVFIAVVLTARRRGSGVPFEYRTWQIVWFADGLITRRQVFWTRAEALKTARLSE